MVLNKLQIISIYNMLMFHKYALAYYNSQPVIYFVDQKANMLNRFFIQ